MTDKKKTSKDAGFTAEEKAAMKEYARERKAQASGADGESEVAAAIAKMTGDDRALAERLHALVKAHAPELSPKTWYGMPAYANAKGQVICFFQNAGKFKARYSTLGFSDKANLDDGDMWPVAFALKSLTGAEETRIVALLRQAVS